MELDDNIIVYDLESQRTFAEVGGYENNDKLGVSYVGLYSYKQHQLYGFFEKDLPNLERILLTEKPTIVGFNSIGFDNKVLQPYFQHLEIASLPQIDILAEINERLGFRMKLESVAQATLGEGKSGTGLDAIKYYREGNFDALAKYCLDDVRVTQEIFEFGRNHGFILYTSGGDTLRMPVSWVKPSTYTELLTKAYNEKKKVAITYLQTSDQGNTRFDTTIDILEIDEKYVKVYCSNKQTTTRYEIQRILTASLLDETYAYQASLL